MAEQSKSGATRRRRSAKIVATLGPANEVQIEALFQAGVDVFRLTDDRVVITVARRSAPSATPTRCASFMREGDGP